MHMYLQELQFSWASRGVTELLWNACLGTLYVLRTRSLNHIEARLSSFAQLPLLLL